MQTEQQIEEIMTEFMLLWRKQCKMESHDRQIIIEMLENLLSSWDK